MNGKTRDWIWIIVGGYLAYTGVQLVMDVMDQKPEGYIGFVVAGVLFAVFGIGLIVYAIRNMTKPVEEEPEENEPEEIETSAGRVNSRRRARSTMRRPKRTRRKAGNQDRNRLRRTQTDRGQEADTGRRGDSL